MSGPHYRHLDALRALAVTGPVILHLWPFSVKDEWLTSRIVGAFLGVELFFVISGFLITGILLDARRAAPDAGARTLRAFWLKRFLRIFPLYWLLLLALVAGGVASVRDNFWWELSYLVNFKIAAAGHWIGLESHFWSLAVEEQFYLLWPLVMLFLPARWILPAILLTIATAPLFRWYGLEYLTPYHGIVLMPACMDVLGLGALLAWLQRAPDRERWLPGFIRFAWVAGGIGTCIHLAFCIMVDDAFVSAWPLARTSYGLLFTAMVAHAVQGYGGWVGKLASFGPIVRLGTISYAVYLIHPFMVYIGYGWSALAELPHLAIFLIQYAAAIALAEISWRLLEAPLKRVGARIRYPGPETASAQKKRGEPFLDFEDDEVEFRSR